MYTRWNDTNHWFEKDTSAAQDGSGPWVELSVDGSQIGQGVIPVAQIPNLDASKITTGKLALAQGGTNADLSATGGASQVLKQLTAGGAISVGQLASSDLSDIATLGYFIQLCNVTYNDSLQHSPLAAGVGLNSRFSIIKLDSTYGGTYIPVYANGGAGVAYRFSFLNPSIGWTYNAAGFSTGVTDGSSGNSYGVGVASGSGQFFIQRTSGTAAYTVSVYAINF